MEKQDLTNFKHFYRGLIVGIVLASSLFYVCYDNEKAMENNTLGEEIKNLDIKFTNEEYKQVNIRLLLLMQLSTLQINISQEIEEILRDKSMYRMQIKHTHKKIRSLIRENMNNGCFRLFTSEQLDVIMEDADSLEAMVKQWAKID